jgi:[glutamine synthetase] adenylyltransferase / [glutamine synthetase]-adenylyl-L-tyrosine phosphorylase
MASPNPENSGDLLAQVRSRFSSSLADSLPSLIAESPDPDSALFLLDRLLNESPDSVRLLDRYNFLAHYATVIFGHSRYLGETLIRNLDLLSSFLREKNLDRSFSREEFHEGLARFRSRSFETNVSLLLARFKKREYIRIVLRDVLKLAPLAETTAEISALADVLIEDALREADSRLQGRYGSPQHVDAGGRLTDTPFAVLSLGKLGGNELNYSSDVDLMYIFGDGEEPAGATISNHEYFVRLAQEVTGILSRVTAEGPVFRIDLRLRPQGNEGELAISLSHALRYYDDTAHDWERQALIKVRYSAGDIPLAREFIRSVQPDVYSYAAGASALKSSTRLNFAAIETALEARERMRRRRHYFFSPEIPGEKSINVKFDRGGIRDIEFLVQCLQRVYGGSEPWLRSRGTLFALQKLHDKNHITGREFHDLTTTYEFLRHLEHRLQLREGQQTHRLPTSPAALDILQRSMEGYAPGEDRGADVIEIARRRMAAVSEIYQRIVYQQSARGQLQASEVPFALRSSIEPSLGDQSNQQILDRLATDAPALHEKISQPDLSLQARRNLFRFLTAAFASSERYAAVLRYPEAVVRALDLFDCSEYLSSVLIRHPEEIATIATLGDIQPRTNGGYLFETAVGQNYGVRDPVFTYIVEGKSSYSDKLSLLRRHFRHCVLAEGAKDIAELRSVYDSLGSISAIAEDAVAAAFRIAGSPPDLGVMALGRLGTAELDVLSDVDVLFVCGEGSNTPDLIHATEKLVETLSAYTRDGTVFPIDARLRPRGSEGELLVTPTQLTAYFAQEAQPWEALMYTKMRFLSGSRALGERATAAADGLLYRFSKDEQFAESVREMRSRLEAADVPEKSFKTSPGATYDIDFLTSFLMVKHNLRPMHGNLRDRVWGCAAAGLFDRSDAAMLDHAAELLRTVEHVVRLAVGHTQKWLPPTEHAQHVTERLVGQILDRTFPDGLEAELMKALDGVRGIYGKLLPA